MDYIHLGRTGLLVSPLCLGTMNFGPLTTEGDSHAIMDRALEHGINFFDTANVYGWRKGEGVTEQIVGRWFARGEGRLDLYQMHHVDLDTPWEEIWQAMDVLVAQGKVVYVGSSNFAAWNIVQANEIARSRNFLGLVSEQSLYNLVERTVELELLPACRAIDIKLADKALGRLDQIWPGPGGPAPAAYAW